MKKTKEENSQKRYDLILYDTSNFKDFPIGGQLTSIRNFLKYLSKWHPDFCKRVLLVGISTVNQNIGILQKIYVDSIEFDYLPVLYRDQQLSNVKKSLRVEYLKALLKRGRQIKSKGKTIHYIHTPEAFLAIKTLFPKSITVVFSHGSFFNMSAGFRFYNNKIIYFLFNKFLVVLLKKADLIFTLDEKSTQQYIKFTNKIVKVDNSIVLPEKKILRTATHSPIRLLFVGRLSKVKQVDKLIEAMDILENATLQIIGDGEEYVYLKSLVQTKHLESRVNFKGAALPSEIHKFLEESDILVMNSVFEGKPMTILEALSYGLPIITTPVGGIPEITSQNKNTEYTNGTKESIRDAVYKITKNYIEYSRQAYIEAKKYDYYTINNKIFDELHKILEKNS